MTEILKKEKSEIEKEIESVAYFIEKSPKTGEYTLALKKDNKKTYVLSKYRPREHAIKQIGDDWGNKRTIWILIGFGFGYSTNKILDTVGENTTILIMEPNQNLLQEQFKIWNKKNSKVYYVTTIDPVKMKEQIASCIPRSEVYNFKICYLEGYLDYYKLYCNQVIEAISDVRMALLCDFYTRVGRGEEFQYNILRNARYLSEVYDIEALITQCRDIPAIVVCAGPSLEKNIDDIKNFKGIVIALGRTMTPLFKHGIRPDFVVSVDPTNLIYDTFGDYKVYDVPLVTLIEGSTDVVKGCKAEKYFIHNELIITGIFKSHINPVLDVSNTVSSLGLSFAQELQCNPVVIVGQDLAFTGDRHHAEDKEQLDDEEIPEMKMTKGYYGGEVKSCIGYIDQIRWIESQVLKRPEILHINATEGGAYIEGMTNMPLKQVIETYCIKDKPQIVHKRLVQESNIDYEKCMKSTRKTLRGIKQFANQISSCYQQLEEEYAKEEAKNIPKMRRLFQIINQLSKNMYKLPNVKVIMKIVLEKVEMVLSTNNENKEQLDETEDEEYRRTMSIQMEKYEYLAKESENLIILINMALEDQ